MADGVAHLAFNHDDMADLHANTSDGVHIASAGGVWNALVYGFSARADGQADSVVPAASAHSSR